MASKLKPQSTDTKLQLLDEIDKKVKSKTQIANVYGVASSRKLRASPQMLKNSQTQ